LNRTNLSRAELIRALLDGAELHGADMSNANLSGARLNGAKMSGANLSDANLIRAELRGAELRGADLRLAEDLTQTRYPQRGCAICISCGARASASPRVLPCMTETHFVPRLGSPSPAPFTGRRTPLALSMLPKRRS
jgi:hypothetical protein